jgi:ribosome-binding protein aMBF1 (putative translation factor)
MKKLPSRANLKSTIAALKSMPNGSVIRGKAGALEQATSFSAMGLEQRLQTELLDHNIGEMLRQARQKNGLTGAELAKRLGISKVRVSQLERVGSKVEVSTLVRVANALGYDLQVKLVER